jgi:hypothetical protein
MIDTQQQYIELNIRGEISIIVMNKCFMIILRLIRRVKVTGYEGIQWRGLCKHIICNRFHLTITDDEYYKYL